MVWKVLSKGWWLHKSRTYAQDLKNASWPLESQIRSHSQKLILMCYCYFIHMLSHFSSVRLGATPWTVAYQAPLSMGFSRQECWSGLPFPSPGGLPDPGIEPRSPALQADVLPSEPPGKPQETPVQFLDQEDPPKKG